MSPHAETRRGLWIAAASFILWGLMPLYWHLLAAVPSLQIVVHRIVWSALFVCAWLTWQRRRWLAEALLHSPAHQQWSGLTSAKDGVIRRLGEERSHE